MKLRVLWFGRRASSSHEDEVELYRRRVARRWPAEDCRLRPSRPGREAEPGRALRVEAEAIRRHVPAGWAVVAMDEAGTRLDSEGFARLLHELEEGGRHGVALIVGSDLGLAPELLAAADRRLSLGPLTLPHRLARLVLWEQIFRATDILGGGRYHRRRLQYGHPRER